MSRPNACGSGNASLEKHGKSTTKSRLETLRQPAKIREICNSVAGSAEKVAGLFYGPNNKTKEREMDRYERAKKRAEKKVEQISDELLRDAAIYQILNFCMKAKDVESSEKLYHQLQSTMIKIRRASNIP